MIKQWCDSQKLFNIQVKGGILDQWDLTVGGANTETEQGVRTKCKWHLWWNGDIQYISNESS